MASYFSSTWRVTRTALGIFLAAWSVPIAQGQTTYTFQNPDNEAFVEWHDTKYWNPSGIPNAAGDAVIINRPTVTPSAPFSIIIDQATTVGSITVDNTGFNSNHNLILDNGGTLTFQSTSGPASLTETVGGASAGRLDVWPDITLLSDLVTSQNNRANLNTSSFIRGVITGASNRTITKEGLANLQVEHHGASGFQGQYIINDGGIRFIGSSNIAQSTGITVNAGGQLQFNAAAASPIFDWSLADGAVLNLNGLGKDSSSNNPVGALRFQGQAGQEDTHAKFHSPVVLQTDARIAIGPASVTGELTGVVSGSGGLIKAAVGTLILSNPNNAYAGDTVIQAGGGTLSITHPFLADDADVYLATDATLNLDFSDTDVIRSLYLGGEQQASGTWGAIDNFLADFQTDLITGEGLLQVMVGAGIPGDYNDDGIVDAADYVLWRKNPAEFGGDPEGYQAWRASFGQSSSGAAHTSISQVPEPSSAGLVLSVLLGGLAPCRAWSRGFLSRGRRQHQFLLRAR